MDPNINLIKALVTTLQLEVEALDDRLPDFPDEPIDLHEMVRDYESKLIRAALLRTGGNQRMAAKLLKIKSSTLNTKIKQQGINYLRYKPDEKDEESLARAA